MFRRFIVVFLLGTVLLLAGACRNKNVKNPLASVDSKQPDKVLFDRAMDAMQKRKYDVARLSLQTLINTYPDSEYVARAKLGIGDSWYAEGGSAAYAQAENEYKDFITFFPNMPEAAEAQLKVADIHYKQMEKADRDYTHAKRAEDEYRQVLLQYPDSKLAETARLRLLQVQEVLAEREYRIGRFYYLRGSWAAAIARLKSVTDTYPLYSMADDALYMLGQADEQEIALIRKATIPEVAKAKLIKEYTDGANAAYSKIITRYPVMPRVDDAKARLKAMDLAVPTPTEEAIALNKKEMASRGELSRMDTLMSMFHKHPDLVRATKVGEPTLVDPKQTDATEIVRQASEVVKEAVAANNKVSIETVKDGKVPDSQPVPRSDNPPSSSTGSGNSTETVPNPQTPNDWNTIAPDNSGASSSSSTPTNASDVPKAAPEQVNEAATDQNTGDAATNAKQGTNASAGQANDKNQSSSKKKKKKKFFPF
jgi:outer membrane protein assembly factor BamD